MGLASVCSKAIVLLLLIHWLYVLSFFVWMGVVIGPCFALLSGISLLQPSGRGSISWLLYFNCLLVSAVFGALCLFLTVSWVGLQCVIEAFPGHTYLILRYISHDCFFFFLFHLPNYCSHYSLTLVLTYF